MTAHAAVPHRPAPGRIRPFAKAQVKTPVWLKLILGRELSPSRAEYDAVVDALWDGDAEMDLLIDWMYEIGPQKARPLFQQAINQGVASIPDAPEPLRRFFKSVDNPPAWLDRTLVEEGVRFIHGTGLTSTHVLRDLALMGGYLLSGFNQTLVKTGALNKGTAQRIAETGKWWMDCTKIGGMDRFGDGFKTTLHVRMVHALVRRNLAHREDWDAQQWGLPVNQIDMVATYLGFSVVMLGGLRKLGIPVTPRESKAVMQLWSYACWVMGVDEKWLRLGEREGLVLLNHTFMTQSKPDATSQEMAQALAREPLERHFERFEGVQRRFFYHQHLSVSQFFLGSQKMAQLGLPDDVLPWYPWLTLGPRFALYSARHWLPGQRERQQKQGRAKQEWALATLFGEKEHKVIQPGANHPAHT